MRSLHWLFHQQPLHPPGGQPLVFTSAPQVTCLKMGRDSGISCFSLSAVVAHLSVVIKDLQMVVRSSRSGPPSCARHSFVHTKPNDTPSCRRSHRKTSCLLPSVTRFCTGNSSCWSVFHLSSSSLIFSRMSCICLAFFSASSAFCDVVFACLSASAAADF